MIYKNRSQLRKAWIENNGNIPNGYNLHHIIPIHAGGKHELNNIELLSEYSHAIRHRQLFFEFGRLEDLSASLILKGDLQNANTVYASMGGKKSQEVLRANKVSAFYDPDLRDKILKKARKKQMETKTNKLVFSTKEEQSSRGKIGGKKNKGFVWINNGKKNIKYTLKMQKNQTIEEFLQENKNFIKGRTNSKNKNSIAFTNKDGKRKYYTKKLQKKMSVEEFINLNQGYKKGYKYEN